MYVSGGHGSNCTEIAILIKKAAVSKSNPSDAVDHIDCIFKNDRTVWNFVEDKINSQRSTKCCCRQCFW